MVYKFKLDYEFLKVFGCEFWPNLRPYTYHKLNFWSMSCVFLGYSSTHKGYKCMDLKTHKIYISRDILLNEISFLFSKSRPTTVPLKSSPIQATLPIFPTSLLGPTPNPTTNLLSLSILGPGPVSLFPTSPIPQNSHSSSLTLPNPKNPSISNSFESLIPLPSPSSPTILVLPRSPIITRAQTNSSRPRKFTDGTVSYPTRHCLTVFAQVLD